jgi:hypothetical protein
MTIEPVTQSSKAFLLDQDVRFHRSLCWKAVIAGVVFAIGIHLLLLALGAGIGLAVFTPQTDAKPVENFSVGSAIAWSICALTALYAGGWIAGCFSAGPKTGALHGMLVWSGTMIITFVLVASGGGLALGGAVKALGEGLGMTGKEAASGLGDVAKEGAKRSGDQLNSFIDEAVKASPTNAAPNSLIRAKREIDFAVTKLFSPGNDFNSAENQAAVTKAIPTSLLLPCGGTGTVHFVPLPKSPPTSHDATVRVAFIGQP